MHCDSTLHLADSARSERHGKVFSKGSCSERMSQVASTGLSGLPHDEQTSPKGICRGCSNYPPPREAVPRREMYTKLQFLQRYLNTDKNQIATEETIFLKKGQNQIIMGVLPKIPPYFALGDSFRSPPPY